MSDALAAPDARADGLPTASPAKWLSRASALHSRSAVAGLIRVSDLLVVAIAGVTALLLRFGLDDSVLPDIVISSLMSGILLAVIVFPLFVPYGFEDVLVLNRQIPKLLVAWSVVATVLLALLYAMKTGDALSRLWMGYWVATGCVALALSRVAIKFWIIERQRHGALRRNVVVVGDEPYLSTISAAIQQDPGDMTVQGALALPPPDRGGSNEHLLPDLESRLRSGSVYQVIVGIPLHDTERIQRLLRLLRAYPVEAVVWAGHTNDRIPLLGISDVAGDPGIRVLERPLDGWKLLAKSIEDRVLGGLLLALFALPMLVIGLVVKIGSPGPILFRQLRHGFNHEPIEVLKFRTMYVDQCDTRAAAAVRQATRDDPRVTPIGRFLRRTSLDELPQLLNVLRGDMSLVGPRPHALAHNDHYAELIDNYLARHRVKPGITGWAQVNGCRGETKSVGEMRRRIELDLEYVGNWSLRLDIEILLKSVLVPFEHSSAF